MQTFKKLPKTRPRMAQRIMAEVGGIVESIGSASSIPGSKIQTQGHPPLVVGVPQVREAHLGRYIQGMASSKDAAAGAAAAFAEAVSIMHRLRAPGGCPWDREQTFETIETYALEELYEVFDAISRNDWNNLRDELGDLLLQVLFYAEMASETGRFTITEVVSGLNRKLVRRHPHVFPDEGEGALAAGLPPERTHRGINSAQVVRNWDRIKQAERSGSKELGKAENLSRLDAISRALPALAEARKLGSSAHKVGFDWPDAEGIFQKMSEEIGELREAMEADSVRSARGEPASRAVADEMGDLLFTAANLARRLGVDPERALRASNTKFRRRFAHMEKAAFDSGGSGLESLSPGELESLWQKAKTALNQDEPGGPAGQ